MPSLLGKSEDGKSEDEGKCPICDRIITLEGLIIPSHVNNLLGQLVDQEIFLVHDQI